MALSSYLATLLVTATSPSPAARASADSFELVLIETRAAASTETRFLLPGNGQAEIGSNAGKRRRTCAVKTRHDEGRDRYEVELACHSDGEGGHADLDLHVEPRKTPRSKSTLARVTTPDGATVELVVAPR